MTSPKELLQAKKEKAGKELEKAGFFKPFRVYVGSATCENAAGAQAVMEVFAGELSSDLDAKVYLSKKGCSGRCNLEPTVEIVEEGKDTVQYVQVTEEKARQIIDKHLKNGEIQSQWVIK